MSARVPHELNFFHQGACYLVFWNRYQAKNEYFPLLNIYYFNLHRFFYTFKRIMNNLM